MPIYYHEDGSEEEVHETQIEDFEVTYPKAVKTSTVPDQQIQHENYVDFSGTVAPKFKHASTEQMKEDVSWLQTEGDFVSNMNKYYKDTGITFQEAAAGKDRFTMYDASNDETSEEISLPNAFEGSFLDIDKWEDVNANVKNFFNRDKKTTTEFQKAKVKMIDFVAQKLEDPKFLTKILGEDFDFSYIEKQDRGGKSGAGEENDYEKVLYALKEEVGAFGPGITNFFDDTFFKGDE